jgi:hypothetical protein
MTHNVVGSLYGHGLFVVGQLAARNDPRMWLEQREWVIRQDKALACRVPSRCVLAGELMVQDEQHRSVKMDTLLRMLFEREGSRSDVLLPLFPD